MKKLLKQIFGFIGVSGIGWIIDFTIYTVLTSIVEVPVFYANMISSVPAITFVFMISTHKIFSKGEKLPLSVKYILYLLYQLILVTAVSAIAGRLALWIAGLFAGKLGTISKILAKICITPITMAVNFVVMKFMAEKL